MLCTMITFRYCRLGLVTCKNRRPYNLYCVGGDVKPCSINQSPSDQKRSVASFSICCC